MPGIVFDDEGNIVSENEEIVEQEEQDEKPQPAASETEDTTDEYQEEEQESESDSEDHEESDDQESEQGELDEREAIRARRREERRHRKEAQREREDNLRRELAARDSVINELRARQDALERRNIGSELGQIEEAKRQAATAYNHFKDQIRIATEMNNGQAVADATEKMMQIGQRYKELEQLEATVKTAQQRPTPLDPRLMNHAQNWVSNNKWFDPAGKDPDSAVAKALDAQLSQEGFDPTTEQYWKELTERVKKYLPHRSGRGTVTAQREVNGGGATGKKVSKSIVSGSGRETGSSSGSGRHGGAKGTGYTLSPERVQAIKDAGLWDDPKQRAAAVNNYRAYDKQNKV